MAACSAWSGEGSGETTRARARSDHGPAYVVGGIRRRPLPRSPRGQGVRSGQGPRLAPEEAAVAVKALDQVAARRYWMMAWRKMMARRPPARLLNRAWELISRWAFWRLP